MEDVLTREEKSANFQRLLARQNAISAEKHAAYVGKALRVLVDGRNDDGKHTLTARTDGGRLVHLDGGEELIGGFYSCRITGSSNWALFERSWRRKKTKTFERLPLGNEPETGMRQRRIPGRVL